jgi:hypothetical protein
MEREKQCKWDIDDCEWIEDGICYIDLEDVLFPSYCPNSNRKGKENVYKISRNRKSLSK